MTIEIPDWSAYELTIMRVGLAFVLLTTARVRRPRDEQPNPVGVARLVDLSVLGRPAVFTWFDRVMAGGIVLFAAGMATPAAAAVLAVGFTCVLTLDLSQGWVGHGRHLVAIALWAQAGARLAWWGADRLDVDLGHLVLGDPESTAAWWTIQAMAAAYFASGVSKVALSGLRWVQDSPYLLLRSVSRAAMAPHEIPTNIDGRYANAFVARLSPHLGVARLVFGLGLLLELAAPFALVNRWTLVAGGVCLLVLHRVNALVLRTRFPNYEALLVLFWVNPQYLVGELFGLTG